MPVSIPTPVQGEPPPSPLSSPSPTERSQPAESRWLVLLSAAAIVAAIVAVYLNSFSGAMVFDDHNGILENPRIRNLSSIGEVVLPRNADVLGGRPLISLSLALNYAIGEDNPFGYHIVNVLIHALSALVLFGIVRRTLALLSLRGRFGSAATPLALAVALVWAVHPLSTAAVTYIIQRTESLMALFYLLTLYCVIRGATTAASASAMRRLWYVAAVVSCLLGMVTKDVMFTAPLVVLIYDGLFLAGSIKAAIKERLGLYASLAATWSLGVLMLWISGFHGGTSGAAVRAFTWQTYLKTEPGVILHYLQLAFWPAGLCLDYNWPPAETIWQIVLPGAIVVVLLALTVVALIKRSPLGFLGAAFFLILAPTSSFVPIKDAAFDHRMYLPLAALAALAVIGAYAAWTRLTARGEDSDSNEGAIVRWIPAAVLAAALIALGWTTIERNNDYRTEEAIWGDVITKRPDNPRAYANLGYTARLRGQTAVAIDLFEHSLKLNPDEARVQSNLGEALAEQGKIEEAIDHDERAIKLEPTSAQAQIDLGAALVRRGSLNEAAIHYRKALELDPSNAEAHSKLAELLVAENRLDEAIQHAEAAVAIKPDFAEFQADLAIALFAKGQLDLAVLHFRKALALLGNDSRVNDLESKLAVALAAQGHFDEAIGFFERDIRRRPNDANARFELASLYDKNHQLESAAAGYLKVLELDPKYLAAHLNLAAILERQGQLDEAISHYNDWLDVHPDDAKVHVHVGDLYIRQSNVRKARDQYRTALAIDPRNAGAHKSLGNCYIHLDQPDEAIEQFQSLVELTPNDAAAHNDLAVLLGRKGRQNEAKEHFEKAAALDPKNADAHYNLGMIYYMRGEGAAAATQWRAAVRLQQNQAAFLRPLAWLLATSPDVAVRDGAEAVKLAERAVQMKPLDPNQLGTLAAAYAEAGQFPKAVANAERALDLAMKDNNFSLADELTDKLKLYRSGAPFREKPRSK
jgi:tetratricopeptide (TPR) repeat protein